MWRRPIDIAALLLTLPCVGVLIAWPLSHETQLGGEYLHNGGQRIQGTLLWFDQGDLEIGWRRVSLANWELPYAAGIRSGFYWRGIHLGLLGHGAASAQQPSIQSISRDRRALGWRYQHNESGAIREHSLRVHCAWVIAGFAIPPAWRLRTLHRRRMAGSAQVPAGVDVPPRDGGTK